MTTESSSLYSVIIVSSEAEESSPLEPSQENSKIALPARESATIAYRAARFLMDKTASPIAYRARTTVCTPAAVPQLTV